MTHWGAGGVDRSLDSGLQWGQVTTTLSAWGTDIARDDPNVVVFGVYSGLLMYVSFDGGTTFTTSSIGGSNYGVYTRDRNCMLAEQGDGLYKMYTSYSFTPTGTQSVQVLSPNGGETWEAGTVQNVTWSATNMPLAIIEYEAGPSGPWIPVAQVPGYTGSYAWTVPHDATTTARVRVRDGWDASPEDQSDADFTIGGQTAAVGDGTPTAFAAWQNQPNPFAGRTLIHYSLPRAAHVSLDVFNLQGQRVATLVHENQSAGDYHQSFEARRTDGSLLPAGVYFYRFQAGVFVATKKMLLMR
jgi:hypothetical protein